MTCKRTVTERVQSTTRRQNNKVLNVPVAMRKLNVITLAAAILADSAEKGGWRRGVGVGGSQSHKKCNFI